jgi:hypothetical protein
VLKLGWVDLEFGFGVGVWFWCWSLVLEFGWSLVGVWLEIIFCIG